MKKEIRLILNELRKIENTEGSDKITRKKIDEICENHGVTFEELRNSVLRILADEIGISIDELESLSFEKISEKDLDTISGGVPSTKRNIASVMASLSCLTGVYAEPTENIKSSQSSVSQTVDYVVAGSNKSQKTSKNVDANKLLKTVGIPATILTALIGGASYYNHKYYAKYYADVYDRVTKGIYTDSVLDIYNSIPGDKRSKTIIGLLPCEGNVSRRCPQLFLIPPTTDKTTAYKYFISMWDKGNGIFNRHLNESFLVYADGHIDICRLVTGTRGKKADTKQEPNEFILNFRPDNQFEGGNFIITLEESNNSDVPNIRWFCDYFENGKKVEDSDIFFCCLGGEYVS
ncbi:MAG: hypothetical protein ACI4PJ_03260, partial [Acutalibacteraceae bacterium]